ncbi:MAG: hypothetical protein II822_10445 [Prevotella sp.]|nr:hypothetical protein [Prevotella sp.]
MGEIGITTGQFYHGLRWWEIQAIIRGYNRRKRDMWAATRWQTYNLMCVSMANIKEAGIYKPTDLIKFPWERTDADMPTQDEIDEMLSELDMLNAQREEKSE